MSAINKSISTLQKMGTLISSHFLCVIFFLIFVNSNLHAKLTGLQYVDKGMHEMNINKNHTLAIKHFDSALKIFKEEDHLLNYCYTLNFKASCLEVIHAYDQMQSSLDEVQFIIDSLDFKKDLYLVANNNFLYGLMYSKKGHTSLGSHYLINTIETLNKGTTFSYTEDNIYKVLGFNSIREGDYNAAIKHFKKALAINPDIDPLIKSNWLSSIASCYVDLNKFGDSDPYFELAKIELEKPSSLEDNYYLINYLEDRFSYHFKQDDYAEAQETLDKINILKPSKNEKVNYHINKGKLLLSQDDTNTALISFSEAIKVCSNEFKGNLYKLAHAHLEFGIALIKSNNYEQALTILEQSNSILSYKTENDGKEDEISLIPKFKLLNCLNKSICYSKLNNYKKSKEEAKKSLESLDYLLECKIINEESQFKQIDDIRNYYLTIFEIAYKYKDYKYCFELLQKVQGRLIQVHLLNNGSKEKNKYLHEKVKLSIIGSKIINSNKLDKSGSLDSLENEYYEQLIKLESAKINSDKSFSFKYNTSSYSTEAKLKSDQALVQYIISAEQLYILLKVKNKNKIFKKSINNDFENKIFAYWKNVKFLSSDFSAIVHDSHFLYNLLIKDVIEELDPKIRDIVIIPDGIISYVPFESLMEEIPTNNRLDLSKYLVKKFNISYHYSSALLNSATNILSNKLIGFAPDFEQISKVENDLSPLLYNQTELKEVQNISNGSIYTSSMATLKTFKDSLSNYDIIHLGTHAVFDDSIPNNSRLIFQDSSLYTHDVYNLKHNLDLAVLSACKTGDGQLRNGEGLMSISRAFIYTGCKSVITSLWTVNDKNSVQIMKQFYKHLYDGKTISESITQAKRDYLSTVDSEWEAHPYHWATFTMIGNADMAISIFPISAFIIVVSLILISIILYSIGRKRRLV